MHTHRLIKAIVTELKTTLKGKKMGTKEKSIIESIIKWGGWFIAALQSILDMV